ncbi:MAG: cytochrome P450 [Candidatus Binatia bacterium]
MSDTPAFDLYDAALQADPFGAYARLRDSAPVHVAQGPKGMPVYVLSRYDDVARALKEPQTFSSQVAPAPILMFKDPPEHTRLRRTLARAFTPRAIDALAPRVEALACELYEPYLAAGGGDFVDAFAHPLPAMVIGEMLGIPTDRRRELRQWSDDSIRALGGGIGLSKAEREAARGGAMQLFALLQDVLDGYRDRPGDTIGGELARLTQDAELTADEALFFSQFLFVAGHETTTALFACGAALLARQPGLLDRLRAAPGEVPRFVEEVLRCTPSLHRLFRRTTQAVTLHGVTIPDGATVLLLLGAANRDPRRFPAGDSVALDADPSGHLAFGGGIHMCLGAPLARLEGRIGFRLLIERTARIALDPAQAAQPVTGGTTSEFGWRSLPLLVEPV